MCEFLDLLFEDDTVCSLTADDQLLSAARYASSALLHTDLNVDASCEYLKDGTGNAAPTATSTLWVLEIDPDLEEEEREKSFKTNSGLNLLISQKLLNSLTV